jgi:hypothetical protein
MSKDRNLARIDLPIGLVHEWQINSRYELHLGWLIGVRCATNDLQTVDAILMYSLHDI